MSLDPFFSLSPNSPRMETYDGANPNAPYAYAKVDTTGGRSFPWSGQSLVDQHSSDKILLGYDPVSSSDQTITNVIDDLYRRCSVRVGFYGANVTTANQYLLVFRLERSFGSPIAQFFVGADFVQAEDINLSPYDDVAMLLDTPGDRTWTYVNVRLAALNATYYTSFFFKGVDCYLL